MKKSHTIEKLRPLTPLDTTTLARVVGGKTASTSTSGTPAAGDDTIGDHGSSFRGNVEYEWKVEEGER
jgi:hypothetical protein